MNKFWVILSLLYFCTLSTFRVTGTEDKAPLLLGNRGKRIHMADSIMKNVLAKAKTYENLVAEYDAEVYIKGHSEVLKKNILFRFLPSLIPVDRKHKKTIYEMVSDMQYTAPNHYRHKIEAVNGNIIPKVERQAEILNFLNMNIYAPTAYNDEILTPLAGNAFKIYRFSLDSIDTSSGYKIYKIRFEPRQWTQKLMGGYLYVIDGLWAVDKLDASGQLDFAEFNVVMEFGRELNHFFLPEKVDLVLRYKVLGNVIASYYTTSFDYKAVRWVNTHKLKDKTYDLSKYYNISDSVVPIIKDSTYWDSKRIVPLTPEENSIYQTVRPRDIARMDTLSYLDLPKKLVSSMNFDVKSTRMKYSGLLNPFMLGYSGWDGITYKQRLRLSKNFSGDRQLRFRPEIGFLFKRKEVYYKVAADWVYAPNRMGTLSLVLGNGNQTYSSEVTDRVNELLKDSTFTFENLNATYYKDYFVDVRSSYEIFNGFQVGIGVSYHFRKPAKKVRNDGVDDEITSLINGNYGDFTPILNLSYTPGQYYRMDGNRKEYVGSYFPTISFEYARGIPDVAGSKGEYERMELNFDQRVRLGLLRYLSYRIGGGFFSNQKSVYFANFAYFTKSNFPESWDDRIGGVFQLLDRAWYNASPSYAQAHFMYECPFLILPLFKKKIATKYVFSERFYFSQLYSPVLHSYSEIGYGVGNHLFNIGIFSSFTKLKYQSFGVKFAFELFQ